MENKKNSKKVYITPMLDVTIIEMEEGIAAGSGATMRPGDPTTPDSPGANDWSNKGDIGGGSNDFDF